MNFDQKLTTLMHLFKISNSKLSRGINVDASLISRWKSGERKISVSSPHVPKLAHYFLHLNAYHYQKEYLEHIIAARLPEKERLDDASRIHVMADWLISAEPPEPQPYEQPEQLSQSVSLITNISELFSLKDKPDEDRKPEPAGYAVPAKEGRTEAEKADWQPVVIPGINCTYEVFQGRAGKRQAALNLLYQVLHSEAKLELLLTSEDDTRWMTEDPSFTILWARLLRQVIDQGHKITLIHVVNRRVNEIMTMLTYWMPLHMAGHMNSYYYPRYGERKIRQTLFIVKDKYAIFSNTFADSSGNEPTFLFNDPIAVEQYTRLFMAHLAQCRSLFAVYTRQNMQLYFDHLLEQSKKPGAMYNIRHHLNFRFLPISVITPSLLKSQGHSNGHLLAESLEVLRQSFFNRLSQDQYIDVLPLSLLEQIQNQQHSFLACCEIFADQPVLINLQDTLVWLQQTVDALRKYEHYELYLCPESQSLSNLKVNISYKENFSALFSPAFKERRQASTIILSENNILHSLSYYFDDFIQQIPTGLRNKADVIQRLERLISSLSEKLSAIK